MRQFRTNSKESEVWPRNGRDNRGTPKGAVLNSTRPVGCVTCNAPFDSNTGKRAGNKLPGGFNPGPFFQISVYSDPLLKHQDFLHSCTGLI